MTALTDPVTPLERYPHRIVESIRYNDTDRQGHVNNAVFATFCEAGRVNFLHSLRRPDDGPEMWFVLARLVLDYRRELLWPGSVEIGTRVLKVGRTSLTLAQGLFCDGHCVATAETVVVHVDPEARRPVPLPAAALAHIEALASA
ncbi:thioesterase family protein [soil metagenome]